jgi:hypothetical protein
MAEMGWCPSGRLFEAAACGRPLLSDNWEGLDAFFTPWRGNPRRGRDGEALGALDMPDAELKRIAATP